MKWSRQRDDDLCRSSSFRVTGSAMEAAGIRLGKEEMDEIDMEII